MTTKTDSVLETRYSYRDSTITTKEESSKEYRQVGTGRRIIGTEFTATVLSGKDHNCKNVDQESAMQKKEQQLTAHFVTACYASYFETHVWRGKTELQGEKSSCGGCENSHYALTPTICDDHMSRVIEKIKISGLSTEILTYLQFTIELSEEQEIFLSTNWKDSEKIDAFFKLNVSNKQMFRSLHDTWFEYQLNATIENRKGCNKADTRLERIWREKESELFQRCFSHEISPRKSTIILNDEILIPVYEKALEQLTQRKKEINNFIDHNLKVQKFLDENLCKPKTNIKKEEFLLFITDIKKLLALRKACLEHMEGAPTFHKVEELRLDYFWLIQLSKSVEKMESIDQVIDYFLATKGFQKGIPEVGLEEFFEEYDCIHQEIQNQYDATKEFQKGDKLSHFYRHVFGIVEAGKRRSPTKPEIIDQLLKMHKKEKILKKRQKMNEENVDSKKRSSETESGKDAKKRLKF